MTIEASPETQTRGDPRSILKEIRARRSARGAGAPSKEEIDAEINAMRDEDEQRLREIEAIDQVPQGKKE